MNKKGFSGYLVAGIFFILLILIILYSVIPVAIDEYRQRKAYSEFCGSRPSFCYCGATSCEFRTLRTEKYVNGSLISNEFSEDTIAVCNLAKQLNDKVTIFKVGCE